MRWFELSALAAGEFHPLDQSSATEIGIYIGIGKCPRCLPGQVDIEDCPRLDLCTGQWKSCGRR